MDDLTGDERVGARGGSAGGHGDLKQIVGRTEDVPRGILMMILATALFASASAASKWLVGEYPVGEVLFMRSLSSLIAVAVIILPVSGFSVYATARPRDHLLRGMSQSISQLCLLIAFSLMPLAGAVAINFSSPLFAALVSIVWLKERAGWVRGCALLIGFVGVLIVTDPGANSLTIGALFALVNAVMYGTVTIAVRGMTRTESANTLVIWQLSVLAFFHSFLLLFGWRSPTPLDAAMLFGTGPHQCDWTMVLDQIAASGAGAGGDAVLLSDAGVVDRDRISGVGRCADRESACRLGHCRCDRPVPVSAGIKAAAASGAASGHWINFATRSMIGGGVA